VIADWSADGVVDHTYSPGCYTKAVRELPEDARIYSTARSDILAALSRSVAHTVPSRRLQHAGPPVQTVTSLVPGGHEPFLSGGVIAALAAAAAAGLIPLRRAWARRSARRSA
jgi:hypothetical protein